MTSGPDDTGAEGSSKPRPALRIAQLIPDLSTGGAETMCVALSVELKRLGHEVQVVTFYPTIQPRYERQLVEAGVPVQVLGKKPGVDPGLPGRIRAALQAAPPSVLHSHRYALRYLLLARAGRLLARAGPHGAPASQNGAQASRGPGRWIHTLHSPWLHEHAVNRALLRVAPSPRPHLVGVSDAVSASLPGWLQRPPPPVVWNGIPLGENDPVARGGAPEGPPTLLWMGRLEPPKRPELPLRALAALSNASGSGPAPRLLFAGAGSLRPALEAEARQLGVADRVTFLGLVDDTRQVLEESQIFCLASDYEGSPMSVLEAQAAGLAVVASDVGGVAGSLAPENQDLLVPDPSPGAWVEALTRALDPGHLAAARAAGPRWVRKHRSVERMARNYLALYRPGP
ncbi:MAG: glycosyltransferase family 4 protein [Gemmatimonadota bacterium]